MIIVCFIYFDNSLFWPLYSYIPNAKTFLFSNVWMKNSNFKSEQISKKKSCFVEEIVFKIACLFVPVRTFSTDYWHISSATTM